MAETREQDILEIRMKAALIEYNAASIRLETAKEEQKAAKRTLEMADLVARSMMSREGIEA